MSPPTPHHFLLTTFGTAGDVHPLIGLGRVLKARGHQVTLITHDNFAPRILQAGLEFLSQGSAEEYDRFMKHPDLWHPRKSFGVIATAISSSLRRLYTLLASIDSAGKTLVAPGLSLWTRLLQEKLHWNLVSLVLQPSILWSAYDTPVLPGFRFPAWISPVWRRRIWWKLNRLVTDKALAPELNRFRKELGLAPAKDVFLKWMLSPQLVVGAFPDWFAPLQPDWPPNTKLTNFIFYDRSQNEAEEEILTRDALEFCQAGEPPLLFTPGSAMSQGRRFFEESQKACKILKRRAIFVTPALDQVPQNLSEDFRHYPYLPFGSIAPHLTAMIHHGGIGTAAQAIRAGIPQLVVPLTHDQPDNAARLEKLGVAQSIPDSKYQSARVVEKLKYLLGQPSTHQNCKHYAQGLAETPDGAHATADILENFAANPSGIRF